MGFFDRFSKSFEDEVNEALEKIRGMGLGIDELSAVIQDKVVTLKGKASSIDIKKKIMEIFNQLVETDNTFNLIELPPVPEKEEAPAESAEEEKPEAEAVVEGREGTTERIYEVVSGDTLGGIAKKFYGNAGKYMKIFEANRDILKDPNLIKVGQKLRIPE